jgi:hypothetical protein
MDHLDAALYTRTPLVMTLPAAVIMECSDSKVIMWLLIFLAPIQAAMVSISFFYCSAKLASTVNASSYHWQCGQLKFGTVFLRRRAAQRGS